MTYYYFTIMSFDILEDWNMITIHWKHLFPRQCVFDDLQYSIIWQYNVGNEENYNDVH